MKKNKTEKAKHKFTPEEAAGYLRQLADDLESGAVTLPAEGLELESEVKVKEERKTKKGHTNLKIRLKFELPGTPEAQALGEETRRRRGYGAGAPRRPRTKRLRRTMLWPGRPHPKRARRNKAPKAGGGKASYNRLKKTMAKTFEKLAKLKNGDDPTELAAQVEAFAEQGRKMCSHSGGKYGEKFYPAFFGGVESVGRRGQGRGPGEIAGRANRAGQGQKKLPRQVQVRFLAVRPAGYGNRPLPESPSSTSWPG